MKTFELAVFDQCMISIVGKCVEQGWEQMVMVSEKDGGNLITRAAFKELDYKASSGKGKELLCLEEREGADSDNIIAGPSQLVSSGIGTAVGEGNIGVEENVKRGMVEGNKENEHVGISNFVQPLVLSNSGVGVGVGTEDLEDDRLKGNKVQEDEIVRGYEEEDFQRIVRNAKGWNRMWKNNLIKMKWTSKKSIQFYSSQAESDSGESFEDCCSVAERSSEHSEDENWLVSLFNGGEIETNCGLNSGGWRVQFIKKEWKMWLLQGKGAGYPGTSLSYIFGNESSAIFTICGGGLEVGNLGNKLVMSVLYYEELVNECNTGNKVTIKVGSGVEDGGSYAHDQKGEGEGEGEGIVVVVGEGNINGGGEFNNGVYIGASKGQPQEKRIRLGVSLKESKNSDERMGKEKWDGLNRTECDTKNYWRKWRFV
ncbi:hypothetical protein LguiB_020789 [Lonicera macranthoides]